MTTPAPSLPDLSPLGFALRLKAQIGGVARLSDDWLEAHPSEAGQTDRAAGKRIYMERGLSEKLITHIRRVEYQLRCFILCRTAHRKG